MSVIGTIQAFNEEAAIRGAVESLLAGGCDRVFVLDGAWANPDGTPFGGRGWWSTDATQAEAERAGADFVTDFNGVDVSTDGKKRDALLRLCRAEPGDHVLLIDADERLVGKLDPDSWPSEHGCVIHRDLHPNDLPGVGGVWPRGDWGPEKPLLRWIRWSEDIRCETPGVYHDAGGRIHAYLVGAMSERAAGRHDPLFAHAYRVLRDHEHRLEPAATSLLPIVPDVEIHHAIEASPERVAAKELYYAEPVPA